MSDTCTYLESLVAGDVNDTRDIALGGGDLGPDDLVGAVVEGHVWSDNPPIANVNLSGSVVDAARKIIRISFGGAGGWLSAAAAGEYLLEYEITFSDGRIWTWPTRQPDRVIVRAQGA